VVSLVYAVIYVDGIALRCYILEMNAQKFTSDLRTRLIVQRGRYRDIAEISGLSTSWLSKFSSGIKDNPKLSTIVALENALDKVEGLSRG